MSRAPNTYSPEETRRAIQAGRGIADANAAAIVVLDNDVVTIDNRLTVLESMESSYSSVVDSNAVIGNPLYVKANGHVDLARGNASPTTRVVGLTTKAALSTHVVTYDTEGKLQLTDWTAITGTATLTPGAFYYLSDATAGMLTTVAPTSGGSYVVCVGKAISTLILDIEISQPILL
jgi:hypothetical protein